MKSDLSRTTALLMLALWLSTLLWAVSVQAELVIKKPLVQKSYRIENKNIDESSGLACSTRDNKVLWTHNDSGHMPIIYAMSSRGNDIGTYHLDNLESMDWEDMDAFEYQGDHYLLIADTGDNLKMRLGYRISIIKEPDLNTKHHTTLSPEWSYIFQFEKGQSYDIESAAVDVKREKIILLTKRNKPTLMFELPLKPENDNRIQMAVKVAEFSELKNPSAVDISADGKLMSVNTYRRIHRYTREQLNDDWRYEYAWKYKKLFQPEAMCLSKDEKTYFISSEKKPYLLQIELNSK